MNKLSPQKNTNNSPGGKNTSGGLGTPTQTGVTSDNQEFAHIGTKSDENAQPYPDAAWKTPQQQQAEATLASWMGKPQAGTGK